jgi:hypothetical protein
MSFLNYATDAAFFRIFLAHNVPPSAARGTT